MESPCRHVSRNSSADPALTYEESSLWRLHQTFRPTTLQEIFLEDDDEPMKPLSDLPPTRRLFRYIWAINPALIRKATDSEASGSGHHYFGPMPEEKGQAQFDRLIDTYRSIEREGFKPDVYGPIMGYFLADDSRYRFVVASGNHRLAALKVLGQATVPVTADQDSPRRLCIGPDSTRGPSSRVVPSITTRRMPSSTSSSTRTGWRRHATWGSSARRIRFRRALVSLTPIYRPAL